MAPGPPTFTAMALGLRLADLGIGLGNRRLRAGDLRVVLGLLDLERGAREPGEHLAGGHSVTLLGQQRDNGEPVDLRLHQHLVAGDHRA